MTDLGKLAPAQLEQLASIPRAKGFLGREFLTWLWFLADTSSKEHELLDKSTGKKRRFDLWVDDRLVLESGRGLSHENTLKGGDPASSQEAGTALASGKTVRELKLGMHIKGIGDFTAVLSETDLNPRSLKLPNVRGEDGDTATEEAAPIATRLKQAQAFLAALDRLFTLFLEQRVGDDWESEHLPRIRAWVKKRRQAADTATLH